MTRRRQVFALTALGTGAALAAYALWLNFSYLIVPVRAAEQDIPIKIWRHTDYYKIYPGTYRSEKYGTVFTINSRGFRGAEFETGNDRVPRIVTLGDSSVIGNESAESSTWPRRLEHLLAERGRNVEVVNAGISGTMSKHQRALFHAELLHDRPALVIYYAGINDHRVVSVERYPGRRLWPQGRFDFFCRWRVLKAIQLRLLVLRATAIDFERWLPLS